MTDMFDHRRRVALLTAGAMVLLGIAACKPSSSSSAAQPAVTASASADPSVSAPVEVPPAPSSAPASPSKSATPTKSPTPKASKNPEGFAVRPPGTGQGPAGSLSRTSGTQVALTFDDGPDPVNTPAILKVLRDNGVKATFCMVGFRVRDHPELVRQIYAEGHTLCNHSWQHLTDLAKRDPSYIDWDLQHTNDAIHAAVPDAPIKYFRAPGGNFTDDLVARAGSLGMKPIYWDVDPKDWDHSSDKSDDAHITRVIAQVKAQVRQGSIILSHDNLQPDSIIAYRTLVPWLKQYFDLQALPV